MDLQLMTTLEKKELAWQPSTPKDVLRELAKDKYYVVRFNVASNPNIPKDTLTALPLSK